MAKKSRHCTLYFPILSKISIFRCFKSDVSHFWWDFVELFLQHPINLINFHCEVPELIDTSYQPDWYLYPSKNLTRNSTAMETLFYGYRLTSFSNKYVAKLQSQRWKFVKAKKVDCFQKWKKSLTKRVMQKWPRMLFFKLYDT